MTSRFLTVLFADLVDSTRLYQLKGDEEAHRLVAQSLRAMRLIIEQHDGQLLRTVGDSALASFAAVEQACDAAIDIQQYHFSRAVSVRVGFHPGQVIPDDGDVYGNAVNVAARVASYAEANEICVTEDAITQLGPLRRSNTDYIDRVSFKGVEKPMAVYRVLWNEDEQQTGIIQRIRPDIGQRSNRALELRFGNLVRHVDFNHPLMTIGRAHNNDLVVEVDSASRCHARLELVRGRFELHDCSTNGTFIVREGAGLEFLLRDSMTLDSVGFIGLGISPVGNQQFAINYRTLLRS